MGVRAIIKNMDALNFSNSETEKLFLEAYDQYADAIFRYCYLRVYDRQLAEDLTQETFIKTWTYLSSGKTIKNIRAFLYRVAVNIIIDSLRKKPVVSLDEAKEKQFSASVINNVEKEFINQYEAGAILKKLDLLEEKYKDIITLRYVSELTPAEIAEILNISPNVVSVRLNYAVKKFKKLVYKSPSEK
jgi:RNA polymerase sigma-70 factor (ECF subfamily)